MATTPNALLSRSTCPLGTILLVSDAAERLLALDWEDHQPRMERLLRIQPPMGPTRSAWSCPATA